MRQARRRPQPGSFVSTPCRTACRARMQDDYPANGGVRLRRVCDDADAAARSGRLFLCRRCRSQAIVCSCCDRGQAYCGVECARQVRRQAQRAAAERYAESLRGRRCHADRSRRYRARQEIVTHQGSLDSLNHDLLPNEPSSDEKHMEQKNICHFCSNTCSLFVRRNAFSRHSSSQLKSGP